MVLAELRDRGDIDWNGMTGEQGIITTKKHDD